MPDRSIHTPPARAAPPEEPRAARLVREEAFHDEWARTTDLREVRVREQFESAAAPENKYILRWFGDLRGRKVLDLATGLGESSVYFALRGAQVTATDLSGEMLGLCGRLAELHGVSVRTVRTNVEELDLPGESFDLVYLFGGQGAPGWPHGDWDLVILDPPALAKGRGELKGALGAYQHLNRKAASRVAEGGFLLTCSCTYPVEENVWQGTILRAVRKTGRQSRVIYRGGQGPDHPVLPGMPETRYLKVLGLQIL